MSYRLITVLFVRATCRCFPVHSSNARCISRRRSRTAPGRTRAGSSGERRHGGVRGRWVAQRGTGSPRRRRRDGRGGQQGAAGAAASVPAAPRGSARRAVPKYGYHGTSATTVGRYGVRRRDFLAGRQAAAAQYVAAGGAPRRSQQQRRPGTTELPPSRRRLHDRRRPLTE